MTTPSSMTPSPKAVAQAYFDTIAAKDMDRFISLLDENIVWHQPGQSQVSGTIMGREPLLAHFGRMAGLSKGTFHFTDIGQPVLSSTLVVVPLRFTASHATGSLDMPGIDVMRIQDGKIAEMWLISEDQATEDIFWNAAA
jgi:uncharacterized protein